MKRCDDETLPPQYDRPVDLALLSAAIVTTDSHNHPVYAGQVVGIVINEVRYMAQAESANNNSHSQRALFIVLTDCNLQGARFDVRAVQWCERLDAYEESIARLGGYGVK